MTAGKFVTITFLFVVSFDHNHKIICCYFAFHVVASCMIPNLKWSKLQEYLSLHRLLDTFPNMIVVENKGQPTREELDQRELRLDRHAIMSDQYPIPMIHNALNFLGFLFPDKQRATTKMGNERLELWRSSSKERHHGGLTRQTLRNETC